MSRSAIFNSSAAVSVLNRCRTAIVTSLAGDGFGCQCVFLLVFISVIVIVFVVVIYVIVDSINSIIIVDSMITIPQLFSF